CFGILSPPVLSEFKMVIFDRWNEKIFEANDVNECWNGTYKGAESLVDSYIYIISFRCYNGKILSKKGTVTLLK
ncbi:MAG TPA: gliding motility-associated C-terminal domain-containing protein, partial [Chitinophagales bacterium]|nr:gliding motility-associated C-terminal domain-containing protein [Chitinophagales bacterium]